LTLIPTPLMQTLQKSVLALGGSRDEPQTGRLSSGRAPYVDVLTPLP
jgi:hypothetical protein